MLQMSMCPNHFHYPIGTSHLKLYWFQIAWVAIVLKPRNDKCINDLLANSYNKKIWFCGKLPAKYPLMLMCGHHKYLYVGWVTARVPACYPSPVDANDQRILTHDIYKTNIVSTMLGYKQLTAILWVKHVDCNCYVDINREKSEMSNWLNWV